MKESPPLLTPLKILILIFIPIALVLVFRRRRDSLTAYLFAVGIPLAIAILIDLLYPSRPGSWRPIYLYSFLGLAGALGVFGVMEYGILRLLGLTRLGALVRVTYYETLLQPVTLVLVGITLLVMGITPFIPFYTFNEDNKMLRDVITQFAVLTTLAVTVYATAKVVDEEIENRTMLTLMSKPIARWQVILGKYLGIVCVIFALMAVFYIAAPITTFLHWFDDKRIDYNVAMSAAEFTSLNRELQKNLLALLPIMVLQFLQVSTLAAIAVAISTRFSLALNMTVIALLYVIANLSVYLPTLNIPQPWKQIAIGVSYLLPYLSNFDLSQRLVYGTYTLGQTEFANARGLDIPSYGLIWQYTAMAALYAVLYVGAALSLATALFRTRELA